MNWLEAAFEEYKTIREESLTAMQMQQAVLRYGLAIIGLLIATALNTWDQLILSGTLLLVFLPVVCYLIVMIWIGEIGRMMRAGQYLYKLEKKINLKIDDQNPPLNWEIHLRDFSNTGETPQLRWNYLAILGILFFFAAASVVLGNVRIWEGFTFTFLLFINALETLVFVIALVVTVNTGMKFR